MTVFDLTENLEILKSANVKWDREVSGIFYDSRLVKEGSIFVCLEGTRTDGHKYIEEAYKNGACLAVVRYVPDCAEKIKDLPYLVVDNTHSVLAHMYNVWYNKPCEKLKIIGITGTNGKTSVMFILGSILEKAGYNVRTVGTVKTDGFEYSDKFVTMTTPDPDELYGMFSHFVQQRVDFVIMEASSHALFYDKLAPIIFTSAVFTNLSQEHLDFHGTLDNYRKTKGKLFSKSLISIINANDSSGEYIKDKALLYKRTFGVDGTGLYFNATDVLYKGVQGVEYNIVTANGRSCRVCTSLSGKMALYNTLAAISCAVSLGVDLSLACAAVSEFGSVPGRMERVSSDSWDFSVYVDYAHTPVALENALRTVRSFDKDSSITVVFGCGGNRDRAKRPVMGAIASRYADFVIVTSDNSRDENPTDIIKEILKGVNKEKPYKVIEDRKTAIEYAVQNAKRGDIILLAGKGHEKYEITGNVRRPFCEVDIVKDSYNLRYGKN